MTKKLKVSEILTDAGTQVRAGMNATTVADYAEALAEGAEFPPVTVFHDSNRYIAADGFHRIEAAIRTGATEIDCDVREGNKTDALKFALGCNAHHGLRRTNADKRHAVGLALKEFPHLSDRALAEMCVVSDTFVGDMRRSRLESDSTSGAVKPHLPLSPRIGKDGKVYPLPPPPMVRNTQTNGASAAADDLETGAAKPHLPPPPSEIVDNTGWPIPTQLIPLWQRSDEVQEMLTALSRVKGTLRAAQDDKDKLFAEVNFSSALSQLDQAWYDIKTARPFAVCPTCQGQVPDKCTLCKGRGLISEHRWNTCVTREDKEFRIRAKAQNQV